MYEYPHEVIYITSFFIGVEAKESLVPCMKRINIRHKWATVRWY